MRVLALTAQLVFTQPGSAAPAPPHRNPRPPLGVALEVVVDPDAWRAAWFAQALAGWTVSSVEAVPPLLVAV